MLLPGLPGRKLPLQQAQIRHQPRLYATQSIKRSWSSTNSYAWVFAERQLDGELAPTFHLNMPESPRFKHQIQSFITEQRSASKKRQSPGVQPHLELHGCAHPWRRHDILDLIPHALQAPIARSFPAAIPALSPSAGRMQCGSSAPVQAAVNLMKMSVMSSAAD